jgi:glycosyltransferase involved in cell wall biosynthesis
MRIGLFIPNATFDLPGSAEVGGIEVYAFELGEALQKRGHTVILFGGDPKPGLKYRPSSLELSLHPYIETKNIWKLGTRFRKMVQRWHFASSSMSAVLAARLDIIIVFKPYDFLNAWRWKRRQPQLRVVMNYQGKDFFRSDRFWRRYIDWEYAASDENARLAQERYGFKPAVFPNGVNTQLFRPADVQPPTPPLRVLTAGRIVGWKGLHVLIEAAAQVKKVEISLAGDGPERERLQTLAGSLGMSDRIRFLGLLAPEALASAMQRAHCFAQPSIDFDACPTAVLQALSSGLITLMSDQVGLKTYFPSPGYSRILPAGNVAAWAEGLKRAADLRMADRNHVRLNARQRILEQFSWEGISNSLEERFVECLESKGR